MKLSERLDNAIGFFSPVRGHQRKVARSKTNYLNRYDGASKSDRSMRNWKTVKNTANDDILPDLDALIERSRDLDQNNPIATGINKTKGTNVVGTGLKYHARIDRDVLSLTEEQADEWEATAEREFVMFFGGKDVDITRQNEGGELTRMVYDQKNLNGGSLILFVDSPVRGRPYRKRIQIIEIDRLSNPNGAPDTDTLAGGIETDAFGAPKTYHIANEGSNSLAAATKWEPIPAISPKTGLPNLLHVYHKKRPGQARGVPDIHAVIKSLHIVGKYITSEQISAEMSSNFTIFIETPEGDGSLDYSLIADETGQKSTDKDLKMAPGLIVDLAKGEKVHDSNPGRPNPNFDPFFMANMKIIAMGVELPLEIIMKFFSASYSASRGAKLEAWTTFMSERGFIVKNFLKPVVDVWMYEAVASGRLSAPGFFTNPTIRKAYSGCVFIGSAMGHVDEVKAIKAAIDRITSGISTISEETTLITGGDWEVNHKQAVKERKKRIADGLIKEEKEEPLEIKKK